jgi:hypothetical protein
MKKKKLNIFLLMFSTTLLIAIGVLIFMQFFHTPKSILKTAVKENKINSDSYVLAQQVWVTGFDWVCIQNLNGKKVNELCNIIGANPIRELNLKHEFEQGENTFIFYVEERREYFCEIMGVDVVEYIVTGWDILFPIKHNDIDLFGSRWHITKDDAR